MSPDGGLAGEHVGAVIENEICAERLKDNPLRLESMDLAVRTSQPRKFHGMGTDMRSSLNNNVVQMNQCWKSCSSPNEYSPYNSNERPT